MIFQLTKRFAMPLYEYKCTKCGKDYEVIKGFAEDADHDTCPDCSAPAERVFSGAPAVEYHGTGYYSTDHRKAEGHKGE